MNPPRSPTLADFSGAPRGAYVCEEGWLVVGQEAWTLHDWRHFSGKRPSDRGMGRLPKYASHEERLAARRALYRHLRPQPRDGRTRRRRAPA